jgi:hypothetical protein
MPGSVPTFADLCYSAIAREPLRLTLETTYNYDNIVAHLRTFGWDVLAPLTSKEFPPHWPTKFDEPAVLDWLLKMGCPDGVDLLDGACCPMARALGAHACQMLEVGKDPFDVRRQGHTSFIQLLGELGPEAAADLVFAGLKERGWNTTQKLWVESLGEDPLYFGTEAVKMHLQTAMDGKNRQVLPLYILCYVYADDEEPQKDTTANKAMYDVHAVSIVVDPVWKALLIMDPNGSLMAGSNMEFVNMPIQQKEGPATTTVSRYAQDRKGMNSLAKLKPDWQWMKGAE